MILMHIAIRALPELCAGIVSRRLETQVPLGFSLWLDNSKPRHVRGFSLLPPPTLRERRHGGLSCGRVAVGRRAIFVISEGQRPHPRIRVIKAQGMEPI
jgi:hypothetical protein